MRAFQQFYYIYFESAVEIRYRLEIRLWGKCWSWPHYLPFE